MMRCVSSYSSSLVQSLQSLNEEIGLKEEERASFVKERDSLYEQSQEKQVALLSAECSVVLDQLL